ncbi:hypothetical protein D3C77_297120 [compost metagenome]
MVVADQFGLFVVGVLGKLPGGEVLPVSLGADGAGHNTLLQLGQDLGVDLWDHELRLDREDDLIRVVASPLGRVAQGLLDGGRRGDDDAVQRRVLVVLACLAGLTRFCAGNIHDLGACLKGRVLLILHRRANGLDAGALELQVAALAFRAEVPSGRRSGDAELHALVQAGHPRLRMAGLV